MFSQGFFPNKQNLRFYDLTKVAESRERVWKTPYTLRTGVLPPKTFNSRKWKQACIFTQLSPFKRAASICSNLCEAQSAIVKNPYAQFENGRLFSSAFTTSPMNSPSSESFALSISLMLTLWNYGGREILDDRSSAFKMRNLWGMKGIYDCFPQFFLTHILKLFSLFSYCHCWDTNAFLSVHILQCHHAFGARAERLSREFSWGVGRDWCIQAMKRWWAQGPETLAFLSKSWLYKAHC